MVEKDQQNKWPSYLSSLLPEQSYFTIAEAAVLCNVKPHVLRYWDRTFAELGPSFNKPQVAIRRYYRRHEMLLLMQIRALLLDEGMSENDAKVQLVILASGLCFEQAPPPPLVDVAVLRSELQGLVSYIRTIA